MKIEAYAEDPKTGYREKVATFIIDGIEAAATSEAAKKEESTQPKVHISFELSRSGLLQLNKAETKFEETYYVEERIKPNKTKKANETANNDTSDATSDKPQDD